MKRNAHKGKDVIVAERRTHSLELRKLGLTYDQIGNQLGVSKVQAHRDVRRGLDQLTKLSNETADQLRRIEDERLNMAMAAIADKVKAGDVDAIGGLGAYQREQTQAVGSGRTHRGDRTGWWSTPVRHHGSRATP